ncbi:DUF58 domain-containing protein [Leptobacterium sp. I13]|uniref:DUF58 domain-containing protein n=1 Tax=Leptobacterium meishanense TaxID=3128904 RepID=UPI0030EDDC45
MKRFFKQLYLEQHFFVAVLSIILLFSLSYLYESLFIIAKLVFFIFLGLVLIDVLLLFRNKKNSIAQRITPEKLSNGDNNDIHIHVKNNHSFVATIKIIDELPIQFQKRDFIIHSKIKSGHQRKYTYQLRPTERGEYRFGSLHVFISSPLQLISKKYSFSSAAAVPVYPSFLQLKKYDLMAFTNRLFEYGLKRIRRIGHTMEFEQIKDYVQGDDIRNINWKATAKKSQLMVNQYQDERSQPVYSVIDKGRVMKMPFNGLRLLDYAINATLVISNIALKKQDKAGMFCFSSKIENRIVAQRRKAQMNLILETLYNVQTNFVESDFGRLYIDIKRNLKQRSLLLLYSNFETLGALHRQLPYLQAISKNHLLVVIFFKNTELNQLLKKNAKTTYQVFEKTIAEKFIYEKKLIVNELQKHGIQTILTAPEDLTINTINKYLEIKARGLL